MEGIVRRMMYLESSSMVLKIRTYTKKNGRKSMKEKMNKYNE